MSSNKETLKTELINVADAVRVKNNSQNVMTISDIASTIIGFKTENAANYILESVTMVAGNQNSATFTFKKPIDPEKSAIMAWIRLNATAASYMFSGISKHQEETYYFTTNRAPAELFFSDITSTTVSLNITHNYSKAYATLIGVLVAIV